MISGTTSSTVKKLCSRVHRAHTAVELLAEEAPSVPVVCQACAVHLTYSKCGETDESEDESEDVKRKDDEKEDENISRGG